MRRPHQTGPVRRLPLVLATVLVATLLAALGVHPDPAAAATRASSITLRLAPSRVTVFEGGAVEPTGLVAQVSPVAARRTVTFQRRVGSTWRTMVRRSTDTTGRAFVPLTATAVGTTAYRAVVSATGSYRSAASAARSLSVNDNRHCSPTRQPADGAAAGEVYCLLQRLDTWRSNRVMAVGQQLNVSSEDFLDPIAGIRPPVIGFDLQELADGETYSHRPLDDLLELAHDGAVLTATWHAKDPFRGAQPDLRVLLAPRAGDATEDAVYHRFWDDWTAKLALLRRLQDGDGDSTRRTAVVLRPFHEVNGDFFWWGQPTTGAYKRLWSTLQDRAWAAGVHNVVWAYSGNRHTSSTKDPALFLPDRVDVAGLDTYDPERGRAAAPDRLNLEGYASVEEAASAQGVRRMALTETGPHGSVDGSWNPAVISSTVRRAGVDPLWAMLWFDDTGYAEAGRKQILSLTGGPAWLRSCLNGLCYLR